jgi:hypothetical protein
MRNESDRSQQEEGKETAWLPMRKKLSTPGANSHNCFLSSELPERHVAGEA